MRLPGTGLLLALAVACGGAADSPPPAAPGPSAEQAAAAADPAQVAVPLPAPPRPEDGPFQPAPDEGGWADPGFATAAAPCPDDMAHVPAGPFVSGATPQAVEMAEDWPDAEMYPRPRGKRRTGAYCIDRYEFPNVLGQPPTVWVGFHEAAAACESRGRRLCTEDEWARACAGDEGWRFPYGDDHEAGRCNDEVEPMGDHTLATPAGAHPRCESPHGAFDMDGNVSEWVDAPHDADPERLRVLRGGTMWVAVYGHGCMARHAHVAGGPTHGDDGFRCCRDAR